MLLSVVSLNAYSQSGDIQKYDLSLLLRNAQYAEL
jgi:hypothetical protein